MTHILGVFWFAVAVLMLLALSVAVVALVIAGVLDVFWPRV